MHNEIIVGRLDVAELVFYAFVLFFICLIFYLRREDRREGYPLEDAVTGRVDSAYGPLTASPYKRFRLPFDRGYATTPAQGREPVDIAAKPFARFPGAPYVPTGDPLVDGVGPASWVKRADYPDQDMEGRPRIVPMSSDSHWSIARKDPNLVGMTVVAADGVVAGKVTDIWIDRSDHLVRYVDVALDSGRTVMVPFLMGTAKRKQNIFHVDAISAAQFEKAPKIATPGQITRREEDQVMAYFGGGYLYGLPGRAEPYL